MSNSNRIKLPQGSESLLFEEAYMHRKLTEALQDLFTSWGYLPVKTPVFDLFDVYRKLIPKKQSDKIFRLIDRDGDLLMLRSDITLFLARQMGLLLTEEDLPVRVCYADSILRHQNSEDISHNEFFQSGVELIGKPGFDGDIEILLLLSKTLSLLDVSAEIHLGSHELFNIVFSDFSQKERSKLIHMITHREFEKIKNFCEKKMGKEEANKATELFSFIGKAKELNSHKKQKTSSHIDYLIKIEESLKEAGCESNLHIDLSEVGSQAYHTGIVFQVYMKGVASAVISGGRYDNLLSNFGINAPSVGFSILQRKVEPSVKRKERFELPGKKIEIADSNIIERFKKSEVLRKEGNIAIL